jgi:nucleotide-binding universal stress UspA family protein
MYYFPAPISLDARDRAANSALETSGTSHVRAQENVLVPFDGSAAARCALDYAIDRAKAHASRIHLVNVQCTPRDEDVFYEACRAKGDSILVAARHHLDEEGIGHTSEVCFGPVAKAIVECAARTRCSLIVMGARSRSALERFFSAPVSGEVVRLSAIEVAVITHRISSSVHAPWSAIRRRNAT